MGYSRSEQSIHNGDAKVIVATPVPRGQDHEGSFIQAKNLRCAGEIIVFEAQTRGVLQALGWPQSIQGASVDLQSDSLLTANALTKGVEYLEVGVVLQDGRLLLCSRPDISVSFTEK
ncbi:hypothetical protein ACET3Z_029555 [Daucus carota]